jgi:hypothetical protein
VKLAKLRVEAISLIPRIARFAEENKLGAGGIHALEDILAGKRPQVILDKMFAA